MWDNSSKEILYTKAIEEEARTGTKTLVLVAMVLFPLFSILDYYSQHDKYAVLSVIRFATTLFFLCTHFFFQQGLGLKNPFRTSTLMLALASLSITLMCMELEGAESPYYAGVNLVVLAGVLILPGTGKQMLKSISLIIGIYLAGVLWADRFDVANMKAFLNNIFFMVSTGVIGVTASHLKDKFRKKAFFQNLEIQQSIELLKSELKGEGNNIAGLAQQMVDKNSEVQSALELRDSFISMASHELKTPLTALKLQLDVTLMKLASEKPDIENVQNHIKSSQNQITNIGRLVDDMLDISRIQSKNFHIEKHSVEFNDLILSILSRYYFEALSNGTITCRLFEGMLLGSWDPFKLEQVILNLVSNAFRYGGGKDIVIETNMAENFVVMRISDNGPGIAPEDQPKIFSKFERGKFSERGRGLGLGLYITKEIIEAHGGRIELMSVLGQGATFTVVLPLDHE